nr:hypothetical protein [Tanacetum cinerariifolium]
MHNNIMAVGLRDRPLMHAIGRYAQWPSRFLRYIDTIPNDDALRKFILEGPYTPTTVLNQVVPATKNSLAVPEHTTIETILNMYPENKSHFESEKEAIHLILTGIGDEIYSTVDACKTAHEIQMHNNIMAVGLRDRPLMHAIGRYAQWPSRFLRYIDTIPNDDALRKFILEEKEAIHLILTGIGDEIYFTVDACKTAHEICNDASQCSISSTTSTRMVKEVNELHTERIAKTANPLALVATAQPHQDSYYQTSKSHKSYAPTSKSSLQTRSHATTRHKGKEIAKPITTPSKSASEEDSDHEQAQRDKDMQKNWHSLQNTFKKSTNIPTTTSKLPQTPETRMWILL